MNNNPKYRIGENVYVVYGGEVIFVTFGQVVTFTFTPGSNIIECYIKNNANMKLIHSSKCDIFQIFRYEDEAYDYFNELVEKNTNKDNK